MASDTGDLRVWLARQVAEYRALQPRYQRCAAVLREVLLRATQDLAPLAIVQVREKSIPSFAEKAVRKRAKYCDPVSQLTDLCGGRVIARTRSEVAAICRFLEERFDIDRENSVDASQRLKPTEFGYRSVHYIVSFRKDVDYGVSIPPEVYGLKAEVQVRTLVEQAYADFAHDLGYKGAFRLPTAWERELASAAAALEEVDQAFSRIEERLKAYASSFGPYLTEAEMQREIAMLEVILEHDAQNPRLAARLGKLAIIVGAWDRAIRVLSPHVDPANVGSAYPPLLRDLGVALCKAHRGDPTGAEYRQGQRYLEVAAASEHADVDAVASLAGSWKGIDQTKVRALYRRAFEMDPTDPYALGNYLEGELEHDPRLLATARPLIRQAMQRCEAQAAVGINLPWAFFDLGKFHLLLGEPYEGLAAYAKAVATSSAAFMIETSLASLDRLGAVEQQVPGFEWARRLLLLGWAARFPAPEVMERVRRLATADAAAIRGPVVIVTGGTDPRVEKEMRGYGELLREAFVGFEGTIISGGTTEGIPGLVGDLALSYSGRIHTIGYLPSYILAAGATVDTDRRRYKELRYTDGHGFTPLEVFQNWIDLMTSGITPSEVRVLGINGGRIAAAEYRIALALGARVGAVAQSGREVGGLVTDAYWSSSSSLLTLPRDAQAVRAFVGGGVAPSALPGGVPDAIARAIHDEYRRTRAAGAGFSDPAMLEWDALPEELKESNRNQARDIAAKLLTIGCTVAEGGSPSAELCCFTPEEVELLARMEHGRWVVERLLAGWRWGEEKDPGRKTNPYLVAWEDLSPETQELDRQTVRKIPQFLAQVGLTVRRREGT